MRAAHLFQVLGAAGLLLLSCHKEPMDSSKQEAPLLGTLKNGDYSAQQEALETIEELLQSIALNEEFRDKLYFMVDKKFDEETNVLLRDLCAEEYEDSVLTQVMADIEHHLTAFEDLSVLDGYAGNDSIFIGESTTQLLVPHDYYPHLYIPNFDELQAQEQLGVENPVSVVYLGSVEEEPNVVDGKRLDENEDLVNVRAIDEAYANAHEVWVISINERVDDEGLVASDENEKAGGPLLDTEITWFCIKAHHESWLGGGSEVHMIAFRTYWNGLDPVENYEVSSLGLDVSGDQPKGSRIKKISRSDISDWTYFNLHYSIKQNWEVDDFEEDGVVIGYVIFEYDWLAAKRVAGIDLPDGYRTIEYRSGDDDYTHGRWMGNTNNGQYQRDVLDFYHGNYEMYIELEEY